MAIAIFVALFYPGMMTDDSINIYASAKAHSYQDHHPPLMAYLWHYFIKIIDGPHLMFLLNNVLLWSAIYSLTKTFTNKKLQLWIITIPFIPHVLVHAGFVWKDVIFTFGYGLLSVWIAFKSVKQQKFSLLEKIIFFGCLMFFTSVKYQAKFIAPILLLWFFSFSTKKITLKSIRHTTLSTFLLLTTINLCNYLLVQNQSNSSSYSWKFKCIYDLAGISINVNKLIMPTFLLKGGIDNHLQQINNKYRLNWEPLIAEPDSPLDVPHSAAELQELRKFWLKSIVDHPFAYLKHRANIWLRGLILDAVGRNWLFNKLDRLGYSQLKPLLFAPTCLMSFGFILPIKLAFLWIGHKHTKNENTSSYAYCLLYMNYMSLMLLMVLYFFSLASVVRYIYFCNYMFFLSSPFAYACLSKNKQSLIFQID